MIRTMPPYSPSAGDPNWGKSVGLIWLYRLASIPFLLVGIWFAGFTLAMIFEAKVIREIGTGETGRVERAEHVSGRSPNAYMVHFAYARGTGSARINTGGAAPPKAGGPIGVVTVPFAVLNRPSSKTEAISL